MKWWWAVCLISSGVFAQSFVTNVETLGVDNGLSQGSVYSLYQDKKGFLWIGTADGLNRYDGKQLHVFRAPANINEPSNANFIRGKMVEDREGNIWYSTENGLYKLDHLRGTVEKKYGFSRIAHGIDYLLRFIDSNQVIWLQSSAAEFVSYSINTGEFRVLPPCNPDPKRMVVINSDVEHQRIWYVLQRNDGVYAFDTRTESTIHLWPDEDLRWIRFKKGGYFVVGSAGIRMYDSALLKSSRLETSAIDPSGVRDIRQDAFNRIWIATFNEGLWCYEVMTHRLTRVDGGAVIGAINHLTTLLIDRSQNLWVGTDDGGLIKFDLKPPMFKTVSSVTLGLRQSDLFIKSVIEDHFGNIWFSALNKPLITYSPVIQKEIIHPWLSKSEKLNAPFLSTDGNGRIMVGTEESILIFDSLGRSSRFINPLSAIYRPIEIHHMGWLSDGRLGIAANVGMYAVSVNPTRGATADLVINGFGTTSFVESKDGDLWVSSRNHGLFHLIRSRNGSYLIKKNFFPEVDINSIHQDESNADLIWLASDKGLIRFNIISGRFDLYSGESGLNNGYVYGILEDADHRMWCSTNGGISRYDPRTDQFTNYTVKDGLLNNEFNTDAFFRSHSGQLYFGGVRGLTWFKPGELESDHTPPASAVTGILATEIPVPDSVLATGVVELPYFRNDISFRFAVFDFSKPESNKIRCQLKGWDRKAQITYSQQVQYNNLPPGHYSLVFSGSARDNQWGSEQVVEIEITPPIWQRWWFRVVAFLIIISLAIGAAWLAFRQRYNKRIAALEKLNALEMERRRISMEMHDDIGASLTQITLISEAAKHSGEKQQALEQVAQASREVVTAMSEIIWSLNPDNKSFDQLMSYLRDQLHNLLEPSGISYVIDLPEREGFLLSNPFKRNIIQLVKEAANNAVKHAGAKHISVRGWLTGSAFEVEIKDDGTGIDLPGRSTGNGIRNMKTRTCEMGGSVQIVSGESGGTTVHFVFPTTEPYH